MSDQQGADITAIELETEGVVPGIDAATFAKTAETAKDICPVSKALKAVKTSVKATLKSSNAAGDNDGASCCGCRTRR